MSRKSIFPDRVSAIKRSDSAVNELSWLKQTEAFLIDLDGTLFRGTEVIPDAPAFIQWLQDTGRRYLYVTNNSTRTPEQVAEHLRHLGIPATADDCFTSSMVAARYIKEEGGAGKRAFILGEEGLRQALTDVGCHLVPEEAEPGEEQTDYVVSGMDRSFDYNKLKRASLLIQAGATYIATNLDKALPTEAGLLPGSGSLAAAIATASRTEPVVMGKPQARMIEFALEALGGIPKERAVVVGDNLDTDILAGVNAGVRSIMVLTGFHSREDIPAATGQPTLVVETLTELMQHTQ
jgi:4-nitrophenyl phosphatase